MRTRPPGNLRGLLRGKPAAASLALALLAAAWALWPPASPPVRNLGTVERTIVALGDSLTAGVGAGPGRDFPSLLSASLGRPVVNAGLSGDTTAGAGARLGREVIALRPGLVIVCLGGNDFLHGGSAAGTEAGLVAIVRSIQESGAMVVLGGFSFPSLGEDWAGMYQRVARSEGCLLVPDLLKGIMRDPALKRDSIHPNDAGYALMARRLEKPLRRLLDRAGWDR